LILTGDQIGGSSILYYDLAWDSGSQQSTWESYNSILTETVGENLIKATINGLSSGIVYSFKYRAQNIHGWSDDYSPVVEVKTLTVPAQITGVTTTIISDQVEISWLQPYSGGVGIDVLDYTIQIQTKAGDFVEDAQCDGTSQAVIYSLSCHVQVNSLTETPYDLVIGDLIVARVQARNEKGSNEFSDQNTEGAFVES
jgi:hypothetical protein